MPRIPVTTLIAAIAFIFLAAYAASAVPSVEIAVVVSILLLTVFLFAFEVVGVDVAAVTVMVILGLVSSFSEQLGLAQPLILLNDLILSSNQALPVEQQMETWSLFSVTPIGVALLVTGIAYFVLAGRFVLPGGKQAAAKTTNTM